MKGGCPSFYPGSETAGFKSLVDANLERGAVVELGYGAEGRG